MGDTNVKQVDLDVLWQSVAGHVPFDEREQFREAIAEIEAARAAPAPSPTFVSGTTLGYVQHALAGLADIARALVQEVRREREAGPPRAARLVAYRCAALTGIAMRYPEPPDEILPARAEAWAHAMLAAERPAEPRP